MVSFLKIIIATTPIVQMWNLRPREGKDPALRHTALPAATEPRLGRRPPASEPGACSPWWSHGILLTARTVCRSCHTGCPSSQPCTSHPTFPCPTWGELFWTCWLLESPLGNRKTTAFSSQLPRGGRLERQDHWMGGLRCLLGHNQGQTSSCAPPPIPQPLP